MSRQFTEAGIALAEDDALELVLGLCGLSQTDYVLRGNEGLTADQLSALQSARDRRLSGEPVDRILGWRDFYGRRFEIDNVLSPRGDTEVLLLSALRALEKRPQPSVLELGVGSGALVISILCEIISATAVGTDISAPALQTARANASRHGITERIEFRASDWFANVPHKQFDAILSNPPYIDAVAMDALPREVGGFDPVLALSGGEDGLAPYRKIIPAAPDFLKPGGVIALEIGFDQGEAVSAMMRSAGFEAVEIIQDPARLDRVVHAIRPGAA